MKKITEVLTNQRSTYSLEITPDITEEEIDNLDLKPSFIAVTWHAKIHKCKDLDIAPIRLAKQLNVKGFTVLLHLSCDLLRKDYLQELLCELQKHGLCNLLVVLGEKYDTKESDFKSTYDLILDIRDSTGDYFCIGVAGFPGDNQEKNNYLKQKIDIGADFILTQAFFDLNLFKNYLQTCNDSGINVPVIPGLYPFENYNQLKKFADKCRVKVSKEIIDLVAMQGNDKLIGLDITKSLIKELKDQGLSSHVHFYTLNKFERTKNIMNAIYLQK